MAEDDEQRALAHVDYLTKSDNRVRVLDVLTETITKPGQSTPGYEPRELRAETGTSEATLSRILNEFADRGWVERNTDGEYTATPRAQSIAIEFDPFLESVTAIQHLGEAIALLPFSELTIPLRQFADATVRSPQGPQPADVSQYIVDLLDGTDNYHVLMYTPASKYLIEQIAERLQSGDLETSTGIMAEFLIDYYFERYAYPEDFRDPLSVDGGEMYSYDGHIPCQLFIFDDRVLLENTQVEGVKDGTMIESTDETVREWALELFEQYRSDSEKLTPQDVTD